jgi:hypothetical protein
MVMPANGFGPDSGWSAALHPRSISAVCCRAMRDGMRPALHLAKISDHQHKDGTRYPRCIFPANIATHACNRIAAMQCGCLARCIVALHLSSKPTETY